VRFQADTIAECRDRLGAGAISATELVRAALQAEKANEETHAFITRNPNALSEAAAADKMGPPKRAAERPLHGIPISVKDIFDVAGMATSCGSAFYASQVKIPKSDSSYVAAWKRTGAIIIGKTHLNEFAYGITGENLTFGPCLQPRDLTRLTGGSSSGAASSVQAGSSMIGLGTDTGGSIRVPAALCGLVGFRHSPSPELSRDLFPLAPIFDTCGWVQRNLSDLPLVYNALMPGRLSPLPLSRTRIAFLRGDWLAPCEESVLRAYDQLETFLSDAGVRVTRVAARDFDKAPEIFSAIQAFEASRIHQKYMAKSGLAYDPAIRARLEWGLAMTEQEHLQNLRQMATHNAYVNSLWKRFDFLIAPSCPFLKLAAGKDHSVRRRSLLQLTTPFSLVGLPALTFPWGPSSRKFGWQVLARRGSDRRLVSFAASLQQHMAQSSSS
jgi:Asp-tRNA(Asn)/Glu-tRNA(Gln) amidotransferase A subunit family amidase